MGATAELEALHELRAAARVLLAQEADATVDDAALA
ncbi:MAG: hypothetical protein JWQ77_2840, partial [Jatrophihabitans sp.]|nr:hypothetical protein [Jatrophihabitans sp.]